MVSPYYCQGTFREAVTVLGSRTHASGAQAALDATLLVRITHMLIRLAGQSKSSTPALVRRQVRKEEEVVKGKSKGQGPTRRRPRQAHIRPYPQGGPHLQVHLAVDLDRAAQGQRQLGTGGHPPPRQGGPDQEDCAPFGPVDLQ